MKIPLKYLTEIPSKIVNLEVTQVREAFEAPTLIELEGRRKKPLFLSFLLHGNETTSFYVLKKLQAYVAKNPLPRSLILFIGNVYAAEEAMRFLPEQKDYNRVWSGGAAKEHDLAEEIKEFARKKAPLFASIDIHNNTGANPFYACINHLKSPSVYLASLFTRTIVYFQSPRTAQSVAFSKICPSVTLECGQSGETAGIDKTYQYILDVMHMETLDHKLKKGDVSIYETVGRIMINDHVDFDFSPIASELRFEEGFEKLNFTPLEEGSFFAHFNGTESPIKVFNDYGEDVFDDYFMLKNGELRIKQEVIPSMFTKNKQVILQDCLGYIMKCVEV